MTSNVSARLTDDLVTAWITRYEHAWRTNDPADIVALFTADAEYHEEPYETHWIGRDAIVTGWRSRWGWQQGGWEFSSEITEISCDTVTITGVGVYAELGTFDNRWTVTFTGDRCTRFHMVNTERDST
ncbi:nuclear transport factor 2 family protein [Catenuloplanes sp. NPDC051500]|uniref:nuclear transport factor 2 family protein n=1 Tax=Catenuloplanes sp. NPDC051500 TaxID=3363959 RepID=UPI0037B6C2D9